MMLGTESGMYTDRPFEPLDPVPALRHFRLVYESEGTQNIEGRNISRIKVFEYVAGARIPGEGTIEVTIVTNTGRTFVYRQGSLDGEFIVPYATGNNGTVRTTGPYRVTGTGKEFTVREEDVRNGLTVPG
jgi:dolichyl-diphosphooligosaccharide--protein glycosyltransferase